MNTTKQVSGVAISFTGLLRRVFRDGGKKKGHYGEGSSSPGSIRKGTRVCILCCNPDRDLWREAGEDWQRKRAWEDVAAQTVMLGWWGGGVLWVLWGVGVGGGGGL